MVFHSGSLRNAPRSSIGAETASILSRSFARSSIRVCCLTTVSIFSAVITATHLPSCTTLPAGQVIGLSGSTGFAPEPGSLLPEPPAPGSFLLPQLAIASTTINTIVRMGRT